jgi:hypothetical protein
VYLAREGNQLYSAYSDASVAMNSALVISQETLAEVYPVSVQEQDDLLINARQLLDDLFHGAAQRLADQGIDGFAIIESAAAAYPFDDEKAADARWHEKHAARLSPTSESKSDFASTSVIAAGLSPSKGDL